MARSWSPNSISLLMVALVGIGTIGCQRNVSPEMKSITISLPSPATRMVSKAAGRVTAQNVEYEVVIINVHANPGGGGLLATKNISAHQGPIPSSVTLTIPNGSNRLIQVLVAGKVPGDNGYTFMYDDAIVSLSGGNQSVFLLPVEVGSSGEGEGTIAGRILTSPNEGPTGPMNIYIQPPGTAPKMLIESSYVFGGYFSTFYVDDAGFEYFLPQQGLEFFPEGFDITTVQSQIDSTSNSSQVVVAHPSMYEYRNWDDPPYRFFPAGKALFGWFNLSTQSDSAIIGNRRMVYTTSGSNLVNSSNYYYGTNLSGSSVTGSIGWVSNPSGTAQAGRVAGGVPSPSGSEYSDYFLIDSDRYGKSGLGREGALGFVGPYRNFQTGSDSTFYPIAQPVHRKISGGNVRVETEYLPNVMAGADGITGSVILYKTGVESSSGAFDPYYGNGEGLNCSQMIADGFQTESMTSPMNGKSHGIINLPENFNCSNINTIATAICPVRGAEVVNFGVPWRSGWGLDCISDPLKFAVPTVASSLSYQACVPISLQMQDTSGFEWTSSNYQNVTIQYSETGSANIFEDPNCLTQLTASTLSFQTSSRNMVFYKALDGSQRALAATPNTTNAAGTTITVYGDAPYQAPNLVKIFHRESALNATEYTLQEHACTEFIAGAFSTVNGAANTVTSQQQLTWSSTLPGSSFYQDPSCSVVGAASTIYNDQSLGRHFMKVSGISSEAAGSIAATVPGWTAGSRNIRVKPAGPATYADVQSDGGTWYAGECKAIHYRLYSSGSGYGGPGELETSDSLVLFNSYSSDEFEVYPTFNNCFATSGVLGTISIASTLTIPTPASFGGISLWFKPVSGSSSTLDISIRPLSTPSISPMGSTWYSVQP